MQGWSQVVWESTKKGEETNQNFQEHKRRAKSNNCGDKIDLQDDHTYESKGSDAMTCKGFEEHDMPEEVKKWCIMFKSKTKLS